MHASLLRRSVMFVILPTLLLITLYDTFTPIAIHAQTVSAAGTIPPLITPTWTTWGAQQYAVADDNDDFWIGASGGIVRWHKPSQSYQRYSGVDGLPHRHVYAVAVDGAGNRWFGGDGGLSLLDINEVWTHFTPANSGLQRLLIDGIAVGADNTLWVSHGLPDGRVSRRNPDGSWTWFPSRVAAVTSDYSRIVQTQNRNPLWAVANGEIWVDFLVYDGSQWLDRTLNGATEVPKQVTAAAGSVWALVKVDNSYRALYQWQNGTWSRSEFSFFPNFNSYATSFAVAENSNIWVGYNFRGWPYARFDAGILTTDPNIRFKNFWKPVPVAAMSADKSGVWAVGPHWLLTPDWTVHDLADSPALPNISELILYDQSELWLGSYDVQPEPYSRGELQTLSDQGTSRMDDDIWVQQPHVDGYDEVLYTWGQTPGGDLLSSWGMKGRIGYWSSYSLRRYRQGETIEIPGPYYASINDIFAVDDRHIWFAASYDHFNPTQLHQVLALDDGGTPSDLTDDIWQRYHITSTGTGDAVAVDTLGRLWYGNSENLFLLRNGEWQPFSDYQHDVCDLTVDGEGSLYVLSWYESHCASTNLITRIAPDNSEHREYISTLIAEKYFALRTVPHRNKLWTVAPDGAIWYLTQLYSFETSTTRSYFLERYDGSGVITYPLPFTPQTDLQLEVDAYNNVWFVHDNQVWRMSQPPGFVLAAQPLNWQVEPGLLYSGEIALRSRDGYSGTVTLSTLIPSNAISVTVAPNPLLIGQSANFTLTVAAGSQQSAVAVKLLASDTVLTQTAILSVTLLGAAQNLYLPMMAR